MRDKFIPFLVLFFLFMGGINGFSPLIHNKLNDKSAGVQNQISLEREFINNLNNVTLTAKPTRTPRPTSTPVSLPPSPNPTITNLMVILGIITVMIILFGVWFYQLLINKNKGK